MTRSAKAFLPKSLVLAVPMGAILIGVGLVLGGCDGRRALRETPLPPSQEKVALERFQPPEALEQIGDWYPHDWRLHLFRALMDTSWSGKVESLRRADSLHPGEPLIAYELCLAFLDREEPEVERQARPWLDKALAADPGNGVLRVMEAYVLLKEGRLPQARALFMDARRIPGGDFYYPRLEEALVGLFSDSRHLNPYTLTEAVELYRRVPFPPFEKFIDILYSVFLSPLPEHPYDIRIRGRDAAKGLFHLGSRLRVQSYSGPKALSGGYEQRSLGFMFQLKSSEFLTLFYRTFEDTAGASAAYGDLVDVQKEYEAFMASQPWQDTTVTAYLDNWSGLIKGHPSMTLTEAEGEARKWTLWKRVMAMRVPEKDSP
ncbi:MAG: hypothetical protein JWP91_3250 [Fibrobacteres bacterium]|nr:hypothetical protein [Fibrobacterota bacterium]